MAITTLPGGRGSNSASRVQLNTCCTSTSQLRLKVCQVCRWIGRVRGAAPALRTSVRGRCLSRSWPATTGSAASAATGVKVPPSCVRSSSSRARSRATPTTCAPCLARAAAMARPKPRLAPVTSAVVPDSSCVGMRYSLDAYEAVAGLDVGGCWLRLLGCAGDHRGKFVTADEEVGHGNRDQADCAARPERRLEAAGE